MNLIETRPGRFKAAGYALALGTVLTGLGLPSTNANAADAFNALKGSWSGGGSASFAGGQSEKLRCTARYSGGGANLGLNLKCAVSIYSVTGRQRSAVASTLLKLLRANDWSALESRAA